MIKNKKKYEIKKIHSALILFIFLGIIPFNPCFSYSQDYRMGYVSCIVNDVIPEEKINFYIKGQNLSISLLERELDPSTKDKLTKRLQKTNFFQTINIDLVNPDVPVESPQGASFVKAHACHPTWEILPEGVIYDSPIADPKWPRFSAGYANHLTNTYGKKVFNLSFGENFSLLRYKTDGWTYELGIQAGLTGLMDVASSPTRLINSDYFVGAGLSFVYDRRWQNLIQFSHLSSHLGDEFLISRPDFTNKRVNLSYEAFKYFTAYKFNSLRPYIGFGYLVHCDPNNLKPFTFEGGIDYIGENKFLFDTTRFVFGIHTHLWSKNNFKPSLSARTGIQLENPIWGGRHLQFLVDYSHGKSRHGQFYEKKEHYIGFLICVSN